MIIVDSSVWIDFFKARETPQTSKLKDLLGNTQIGIGDLILAEVLQGCNELKVFNETLDILGRLDFVVLGGYRISVAAAKNYIKLRSLGYTVRKTIDTIIATRCLVSRFQLLHNDRDFLPFEKHLGLKSVIPLTSSRSSLHS